MPSEPLPDIPSAEATTSETTGDGADQLPVDLSEFTQRLASFGRGEVPDPLLTEARPAAKRRSLNVLTPDVDTGT